MSAPRPNPEWSLPVVAAYGAATVAAAFAGMFTLIAYAHNRLTRRHQP